MMKITDRTYLHEYMGMIGTKISSLLHNFNFANASNDFGYLTKASAVYSSNIEGNSVDLNSYMNYEVSQSKFKSYHIAWNKTLAPHYLPVDCFIFSKT